MSSYPLVGLGTLLICLFLSLTAGHVGLIRLRLKIKAPAVIGPDAFDRAYRIQMNSIENAVSLNKRNELHKKTALTLYKS